MKIIDKLRCPPDYHCLRCKYVSQLEYKRDKFTDICWKHHEFGAFKGLFKRFYGIYYFPPPNYCEDYESI